ncbi:hypothetical protein FSP39_019526 [Pinctada imbricata]|uniref:Genetic suppressor element-like domain-containing protein n=1 Tax=Pinctada imbricata TaxID=66713 RepID=A0AA89BMB4_PINIB|nr:hypothetical protein FSP39_019526 [Pinctada imbricata]
MMNPASGKVPRNTATVPPLNQVSPSNGVNSIGANAALNATRTSSFAAALRKLAHQAKDPEDGTPTGHSSQPGSSSTSPRAPTPKRGPPPLVYNNSHSSLTSPPVVTIAPTQSHTTNSTSASKQSSERAHSAQSTSSVMYEPLTLKQERDRPQSTQSNRDDDRNSVKDLSSSKSRMTPHSLHSSASPAMGREEGVSRGFQPYRPERSSVTSCRPQLLDWIRLQQLLTPTRPSFPPQHSLTLPSGRHYFSALKLEISSHNSLKLAAKIQTCRVPACDPTSLTEFLFDDPLLLERYRMMQQPYMPFTHPGMIPPPGVNPFLAQGRYPTELLHQQIPYMSQSSRLPEHLAALSERQRMEEERLRELEREKDREREREREKEREKEREAILLREKERAKEREKEYDKDRLREQLYSSEKSRMIHEREKRDRGGSNGVPEHGYLSKADDHPVSRYGSITHGTTKDHYSSKDAKRDKMPFDGHHGDGHRRNMLTNVSESNAQKEDKYAHLINSSQKTHDLRPDRQASVVSRLDLEEKRLREKRSSDPDYSDNEEDENCDENKNARIMLISQGPPLELDTSTEKLKFMSEIGLTSFKVKQELEFEKYRKRRRLHKERSVSPVEMESESSRKELGQPPLQISEDLCREKDFPDKCSFLSSFNLGTIESGRKKGHAAKRKMEDNSDSPDCKRPAKSYTEGRSTHNKNILFPSNKDYGMCREFVEEFHQSVLQSTRQSQKDLNHAHNLSHRQSSEMGEVMSRSSIESSRSWSHDREYVPRWPGVASLLDSYQRHSAEQNLEHRLLTERCRNLQKQNLDLNKKAEVLSHKMADLLQKKKLQEESKQKTQSAIDNIKLCLRSIKR